MNPALSVEVGEPINPTAIAFPSNRPLVDSFGRKISYLRISVTDRCNLRCRYCMPMTSPDWISQESLLSFDEIETLVRVGAARGIRKVRLTGGEPLVRRDMPELVARIAAIPGIETVVMTTNGTLLERFAPALKQAGLARLNISLDSLQRERFASISKFDLFSRVWTGIERALEVGFTSLKINVVVIRGFNDDELADFAALTLNYPFFVRFIEFMPIGAGAHVGYADKFIGCAEMRHRVEERFSLSELDDTTPDAGPARVYRVGGSEGRIGFISPVSHHFCGSCNRIRLTADGKLRGCLMRNGEIDLAAALRTGAGHDDISRLLDEALTQKPEKHLINTRDFVQSPSCNMNRIGG